jgi:molybdopterin synthase sulfur carrier subunit
VPVKVNVTATLRNLVGAKSVDADGRTVAELLDNLDANYPGFKSQISDQNGGLHRFVNIYLNDEDIRYLNALDTQLKEGDVISILPALAGGSTVILRGEAL